MTMSQPATVQMCKQTVVKLLSSIINTNKLAQYGTDGQLTTDVSANVKVMWHKNYDKYQKSGPIKFGYCALV